MRRPNTEADFWSHVDKSGPDECWPWLRSVNRKGYGQFKFQGHVRGASRLALTFHLGRPIRPGLGALHHCDNPPCCNPAHLYEGTPADNVRDREERGRGGPHPSFWPVYRRTHAR